MVGHRGSPPIKSTFRNPALFLAFMMMRVKSDQLASPQRIRHVGQGVGALPNGFRVRKRLQGLLGITGHLTAKTVEALVAKGRHTPGRRTDGDGLHLHVRPNGSAGWVFRYRPHGWQRDLTLGAFPGPSLAAARAAAKIARQHVDAGRDPIRERQRAQRQQAEAASRDRTFRAAMESALGAREGAWKNEQHAWQWRATLEKHALPILGDMPVAEVAPEDVLRVLRPIWSKVPETANRLRNRIEAILDHAHALKWRQGENPARWRGNLKEPLPNPSKLAPEQPQPALPWPRMPASMGALSERRGMAAQALRFAILTAARAGEVRGASWGEVDLSRLASGRSRRRA